MVSKQALKTPTAEMALHLILDEWENQLEAFDAAYADAQWREHFGRVGRDELRQLEMARTALLVENGIGEILGRWKVQPRNPSLARRMTLLSRRLRWAEIESQPEVYRLRNRVDRAIVAFRPQPVPHGGSMSRADRGEILRRHPDRALRCDAWLAMAPLMHQIEADVRELMRRREALARKLGYDGFVSWALDVVGLDLGWVAALFEQVREQTDVTYRAWLSEAARRLSLTEGLRPWDLAFAAEGLTVLPDEAFERAGLLPAVQTLAGELGLGEVAAGVQVDVADLPYAALCYPVRPPDDVRVLLNPRDGHAAYRVAFHELGHALYWRSIDAPSPASCWEASPFNEAVACLWERLASEPDWLAGRDGIAPDEARAYRGGWAARTIYRLRLVMARAVFEYRAYADLDGDLAGLMWETCAEYLGVPFDQATGWANGPFWTSHPVYLQNYVIAEAVASQTLAALRRQFGRIVGEPGVGEWLMENYYRPGALVPWMERVARATGAPLSSIDLIADLGCDGGTALSSQD